jgi:RHS repeat-associated protein
VQDGLGNVVGVIDTATNHVIARYDYGPYGEPLGESGEVDACPFRWQTRWYDPETELYVFPNGRPYTPRLGRWLSRDPIGEEGGFNLYAYCGNDPVNKHDPLGFADQFNAGSQAGALLMSLIDPLNYRPTANGFVLADKRPNALNSSPDFYADRDRAMVVQQGLETTAFTLGNGMRAGGGLLEAGVGLLGSEITFGASLFMLGNGLDNAYAGSASLASGHGVSSLGEQAIYSAAGDGLLGQSLYIATQLGAPFALNQIGSRGPELVSRAATFDLGRVNPLNYRVPAELYSGLPRLKYTKKPTPILLEPYGGPGGGHHVPAKSAFIGDPVYDPTTAPAIPNSVLEHLNMNHDMISGAQQTMYRAYARTGQSLTWDAMELIEAQALVKGGMSPETAAATIRKAIKMLKASGVNGPTRIPWGE